MSSPSKPTDVRRSRVSNRLWFGQIVLALLFGMAGISKSTQPIADLAVQLQWPGQVPPALVRFIGVAELLGAVGLVLPAGLRIQPLLTPAAAIGIATLMACAAGFHVYQGNGPGVVILNAALGSMAVAVAWGRLRVAPITPR